MLLYDCDCSIFHSARKRQAASPPSKPTSALVPTDSHISNGGSTDVGFGHNRGLSDEMGDLVPGLDFAQSFMPNTDTPSGPTGASASPSTQINKTLTDYETLGTLHHNPITGMYRGRTSRRNLGPTGGTGVLGKHGVRARRRRMFSNTATVRNLKLRVMPKTPSKEDDTPEMMPTVYSEEEMNVSVPDTNIDDVEEMIMDALQHSKIRLKVE